MGILQVSVKPATTTTRPLYSKILRMRRLCLLLVFLALLIQYCGAAKKQRFNVDVSFICDHEEYTEALTNPSSSEYEEMAEHIREECLEEIPRFNDLEVESFSNGSVIVDGKADSVMVHAIVIAKKKFPNLMKAARFVKRKLRKAGFPTNKKTMTPTLEIDSESVSAVVRVCVAGDQGLSACSDMKDEYSDLDIICVEARDRSECIRWLKDDKVDVVLPGPLSKGLP